MNTYTGKNLDDALKAAALDKGVETDQLTYTVIEETSGFLGLGSKTTISAYCDLDIIDFMKSYLDSYFQNIAMEANVEVSEANGFFHGTPCRKDCSAYQNRCSIRSDAC